MEKLNKINNFRMMKFRETFINIALRVDRFGVPINIKLDKKNVINTPLGSIMTITLAIIIIVSFSSLI